MYITAKKDTYETSTYIGHLAAGVGTPVLPFVLLTVSTTVLWFLHFFFFFIFKNFSVSLLILIEPHLEKINN